tara:strand:- start:1254 stop:1763 length:510 start_codon:yes stop_codon:yes gene_type:complete
MESHGTGIVNISELGGFGNNSVIEGGVKIFHPENIQIGNNVYVGHDTILKGYYKNTMSIGDGTWIGQQCFFHSAGGITIGSNVGVGPGVKIMTSAHKDTNKEIPILHEELVFSCVIIEDDSDLGINSIILPGVTIKKGTQVGAGSVVTKTFPEYSVIAGVPAKLIRKRT